VRGGGGGGVRPQARNQLHPLAVHIVIISLFLFLLFVLSLLLLLLFLLLLLPYRPPELLLDSRIYGASSDMWSVGCIFGELRIRELLFRGDEDTDISQLAKVMDDDGGGGAGCGAGCGGGACRSAGRSAGRSSSSRRRRSSSSSSRDSNRGSV